ncbi:MAG: TRAP transporter large permease subunit [Hyphomicrobiales bacterium]|nr:TRAP transporter large permease subunit [Hyphomicrobiales bacterium]
MDVGTISIVLVLGLVFFLAIGMPLGFASAVLALLVMIMKFEPTLLTDPFSFGEGLLTGRPGTGPLYILTQKIFDLLTEYVLISVPLFIFMAALLERSGVAKEMYDSLDFWLSRLRGGIAIVTSLMAVIMAAMSGIIGGEVVLLGLIALPQMLRLGYDQNLAIGTICASGSLGTMIPPSIVLIIFGLITETSIKALFTGAFIPGAMLASFIILYIVIRTQLNKSLAPLPEPKPEDPVGFQKAGMFGGFLSILLAGASTLLLLRALFYTVTGQNTIAEGEGDPIFLGMTGHLPYLAGFVILGLVLALVVFGRERSARGWQHGKGLVPPMTVVGIVLGSIYGGITGITEAAGMGAIAVFLIALFRGEASTGLVWDSLMRTLRSTGTIIWVTVGAAALAGAYTLAGGPTYIADLIVGAEMPTMLVLLTMMVILLFMGAFMDWVGIVLLIIPVFLPIVKRLPIEEIGFIGTLSPQHVAIWFGVLFCMNMQVSFLSPPFGPAAFYLKSVAPAHISLTDIFKGFLPFIGVQLLALAVLLIWPSIVTLLL